MGSISSVPNGIAYLAQFVDGVTKSPSSQSVGKILQSAGPSDAAAISEAALKLQQATGIFGHPEAQTASVPLPGGAAGAPLPAGVSAADIANATPNQQATIAEQAQALQQVQNMFYPPLATPKSLNMLA